MKMKKDNLAIKYLKKMHETEEAVEILIRIGHP